ncbi:MAG: DUF5103 domain-containing protein [Muribaculaceae bacterium]|nr:DUF5103 domain-containing protein [Muribaculaceae bacterium]
MVRRLLTSVILLAAGLSGLASGAEDTRTAVFDPDFSTLQVYVDEEVLADPVITLDGSRRLTVEFDERSSDVRYMRYSLTHCNADWQPSNLVATEYIDGFNEGTIDEYDFSRATTVQYVHYRISLPNEQIRFTHSGNYLLKVYDETEPDETLLQARFKVTEQRVAIGAEVTSRTDVDYNRAHQQLSISVDPGKMPMQDAFNDFKVVVTHNYRPDNARTLIHPMRMQGNTLIYEHLPELIFDGGNEYRRFETVSLRVPSMNVESVVYQHPYYHAVIAGDGVRAYEPYSYDSTQAGRYVVREMDATDSDTEADYAVTYFTLFMPRLEGVDIYIEGDLTNRRLDDTSRMRYNEESGAYEKAMLLKQGSYNYQYLAVPRGSQTGMTATVEGNFYNTGNEYQIAVYRRLPSERADRLMGYSTIIMQ